MLNFGSAVAPPPKSGSALSALWFRVVMVLPPASSVICGREKKGSLTPAVNADLTSCPVGQEQMLREREEKKKFPRLCATCLNVPVRWEEEEKRRNVRSL